MAPLENPSDFLTSFDQENSDGTSAITTYSGANHAVGQTLTYDGANGTGDVTAFNESYNTQTAAAANNGQAQTYAQIAASLDMAGITGTVLAALNLATGVTFATSADSNTGLPVIQAASGDAVTPEQATVIVPLAATGPQQMAVHDAGQSSTSAYTPPVLTAAEQAAGVVYGAVINAATDMISIIAIAQSDYNGNNVFVVDGTSADNLLAAGSVSITASDGYGTSLLYLQPNSLYHAPGATVPQGSASEPNLPFYLQAYVANLVPAYAYSGSTDGQGGAISPPAGSYEIDGYLDDGDPTTSGYYSFNGGNAGIRGFNTAVFNSSSDTPDNAWNITVVSDGGSNGGRDVVFTGQAGSGYSGSVTLGNTSYAELGGTVYTLDSLYAGGGESGSLTSSGDPVILAEGAGVASDITLDSTVETFWHINGTNDQITLQAGESQLYLGGPQSDYTIAYVAAAGMLTVSETSGASNGGAQGVPQTGATTITLDSTALGSELTFGDGSVVGLGDTGDAVEYIAPSASAILEGDGNQTLYGYQSTADFTQGDTTPDGTWNIQLNSAGDVVFSGADAGYDGNVTLNGFTTVDFSGTDSNGNPDGGSYNLLTTPATGGVLTVTTNYYASSYNNIVAELAGTTNAITFDASSGTSYLNDVGRNDTLTLEAGTTDISMADDEAGYSLAFNGSTGVLTLADHGAGGNGTATVNIVNGATGEVVFADGGALSLGNLADDTGFASYGVNLGSYAGVPEQNWTIVQTSAGTAAFDGANDGYPTPVTLTGVSNVELGGVAYTLEFLPLAGGATTIDADPPTIVVDGGSNETLTFTNDAATYAANGNSSIVLGPTYWHDNGAGDAVTLASGHTDATLLGNEADYSLAFGTTTTSGGASEQVLTLTDNDPAGRAAGSNGVTTFTMAGGTGDVLFQDGGDIWLGNGTYLVNSAQNTTTIGGSGSGGNFVTFTGTGGAPGASVTVAENSSGQTVVSGGTGAQGSGFAGTAILGNIQGIATGNIDYDLVALPVHGGTATITTPTDGGQGTVVAEGYGPDNVTFDSADPTYMHLSAAGDTLTLEAGYTEIDALGAASDYTITSNGTVLTLVDNNPGNRPQGSNGTTTINLDGGTGDLVFSDGSDISLATTPPATSGGAATADLTYDLATSGKLAITGAGDTVALTGGDTAITLAGPASHYTVAYDGASVVTLTDATAGETGTTTFDLDGGSAQVAFAGGGAGIGLGTSAGQPANYGGEGANTFTLTGAAGHTELADGSSDATNVVVLSGSTSPSGAATGTWKFTDAGSGNVVATGSGGAGFLGSADLNDIQQVVIGGATFDLETIAAASNDVLTIATPTDGAPGATMGGTILAGDSGANTVNIASAGVTDWYAGNGNETVNLTGTGQTNIYLSSPRGDYAIYRNGNGSVTVRDGSGATGTKTIDLGAGQAQLIFSDGATIGFGNEGDSNEYAGSGVQSFTIPQAGTGYVSINGGFGADTAVFAATADTTPDANWKIGLNGSSSIVMTGDAATGYNKTTYLQSFQSIELGNQLYQVEEPSYYGQTFTANYSYEAGAVGTILLDGPGNDSLNFNGGIPVYWHAGGGNDTAYLNAGTVDIVLAGPSSDYTVTDASGDSVVITNINNQDGTGTKTLYLQGGAGEVTFNGGGAAIPLAAPAVTIGSGPNSIVLDVSEEGYQGNSQFTVSVDGVQIGGTQIASASHAAGQDQAFTLLGTFAAGPHTVSVDFLNDLYAGAGQDRNLYVDSVTYEGITTAQTLSLLGNGTQSLVVEGTLQPVTLGSGPDSITLDISGDAYNGDPQFTISVDGAQVGGTQTALALHSLGQEQVFTIDGTFGATAHTVSVDFLNDLYAGSASQDRNLYVDAVAVDGGTVPGSLALTANGTQSLSVTAPTRGSGLYTTANSTYAVTASETINVVTAGDALVLDAGVAQIVMAGNAANYTIAYSDPAGGPDVVTLTDRIAGRNGTTTVTLAGGTGSLAFADGSSIGLGTSAGGASYYGGPGTNVFTLDGTASVVDGAPDAANEAVFAGGLAPSESLQVADLGGGAVSFANDGAAYAGTTTLDHVQQVVLGGGAYDLETMAASSNGVLTIATPTDGAAGVTMAGTILAGDVGLTTLNVTSTGATEVYAGSGDEAINLGPGLTTIYMSGPRNEYAIYRTGSGSVVISDGNGNRNGTKTIDLGSGEGQVVFSDGSVTGFGNVGDSSEYAGTGTQVFDVAGTGYTSISGGYGNDSADFTGATDLVPDANWTISLGGVSTPVVTGDAASGYTGTASLQSFGTILLGNQIYQVETPSYGGQSGFIVNYATQAGAAGTILLDGPNNDSLNFNGGLPVYWHAGGGSDTANLNAGVAEIVLKGAASDYTESYDGVGTLTIANTNNQDGTGTKTLHLNGATGQILFSSGASIAFGGSAAGTADTVQYGGASGGQALNGTAGNDTIYTGHGNTVNGNGGADTYLFGAGDGAVTLNNASQAATTPQGQVDLLGSLTDQNLWFAKSGNNLLVDVIGSADQLTLTGWYASNGSQVAAFDAGGLKIDSAISNLVQAMATYQANNPGFNPQSSGTTMPADTNLQNTIAASWHN